MLFMNKEKTPYELQEEDQLRLLQKKALIQHELNNNYNGLIMIVQKSIKNIPEKIIELAEKECKQLIEYQDIQCMNKCYEPIMLNELSSYIMFLGIQNANVNFFEENEIVRIPIKNTFIYSKNKVTYFGQDVYLSKQDILSASINDFEHEMISSTRKGQPIMSHIKILNQENICNYLNNRPEEKAIYKQLKQNSLERELKSVVKAL